MLVLSRRLGEEIDFPGLNVKVRILSVKQNGTVRVGIAAPRDVEIQRPEVKRKAPPEDAQT